MKLKVNAPLDPGFMPMVLVLKEFEEKVNAQGAQKIVTEWRETTDSVHL